MSMHVSPCRCAHSYEHAYLYVCLYVCIYVCIWYTCFCIYAHMFLRCWQGERLGFGDGPLYQPRGQDLNMIKISTCSPMSSLNVSLESYTLTVNATVSRLGPPRSGRPWSEGARPHSRDCWRRLGPVCKTRLCHGCGQERSRLSRSD